MDTRETFVKRCLAKYGMEEIESLIEDLAARKEDGDCREKLENLYLDLEGIFKDEKFMKEYREIVASMEAEEARERTRAGEGEEEQGCIPPKVMCWSQLAGKELGAEPDIKKAIEREMGAEEAPGAGPNGGGAAAGENSCFVTDVEEVPEEIKEYIYARGVRRLREGKVAAVIMSGGDGSRLGYDGPKGMYPIGKISKDSFFKIFCQRIQSLARLVQSESGESGEFGGSSREHLEPVPLYIMTSESNYQVIRTYFGENSCFGLKDVVFFKQDSVPSINIRDNCSFFIREDLSILKSPNGNGGIFSCMKKQGIIEDMRNKGIEYVFIQCIDNPLCKICDPFLIGYSDLLGLQIATKTIKRSDIHERIGCVAQRRAGSSDTIKTLQPCIIEYTELSKLGAQSEDQFLFGSIGTHLFRLDFIQEVSNKILEFPYHRAYKKIPCSKECSSTCSSKSLASLPPEVNGIKLETFIFDSFAFTSTPVHCVNVSRDEFSPVKSISGQDSPDSCQTAVSNLNKKRLNHALLVNSQNSPLSVSKYLEISSLVSYHGENLNQFHQLQTPTTHQFIYINDSAQIILLDHV